MQPRDGGIVSARVWSGRGLQTALAFLILLCAPLAAREKDLLRDRIDKAIEAAFVGVPAPVADDATFLRRISLDLAGRIPSVREIREFLEDPAPDKRVRAIDRLLASPQHSRHMAITLDIWLMERRGDKHVKTAEWRSYLAEFVKANRPYTELAREVLGADGADPARRAAAKFILDRDVAPEALTRDVGRMFFGMDLQCAQCHDHPRINDYLQRDYYGLYAFLSRASLFQPDPKKPAVVVEKADGDVAFKSVFTKAEGSTRPRMPDGLEIDEPAFAKGEEYQVKPDPKDKNLRPVPKFSRRGELARLTAEGASRAFNRNIANRLWAHMMGRGLVEPVDLHHSDNPPSHPELLEMLGNDFAAMKYDIRSFLRELALTRAYQRGMDLPAGLSDPSKGTSERLAALDAEAARLKGEATTAEESDRKARQRLEDVRKAAVAVASGIAKADAGVAEAKKACDAARRTREAAEKELSSKQDLQKTVADAAAKAAQAASLLAGDGELAAAAATFKARSEKQATEIAALAKDVAEKAAATSSTAAKLEAAEKVLAADRARLGEANAEIRSRFANSLEADGRFRIAKAAAASAAFLARDTRALAEYAALSTEAARSREALKQIRAELAAARDAVAKLPKELPAREARVAEAKKAHEAALLAADAARRDAAAKEEILRSVAEAAAKAEEVAQKASNDAELVAAAGRIKARREQMGAECAGLRKSASQAEAACRTAAEEFAAAVRAKDDLTGAKERIAVLEAQVKPASEKAAADALKRDEVFGRVTTVCTHRYAVAVLEPLTPEQICWSMMQATGVVDQQRAAAEAEFGKKTPPAPEAERAAFVEKFVYDKLGANESAFVKVFGGGPGQPQDEFYATVDQALFLENGGLVRGWLAPAGGNLTDRLMKLQDSRELARELYLSAFTRLPSQRETDEVVRHVAARPQARLAAIQEIVWATLTSVEFRFKH